MTLCEMGIHRRLFVVSVYRLVVITCATCHKETRS